MTTDEQNLKILALDSATPACSAALQLGGEVRERYETGDNLHSERLLPMIHELLEDADARLTELDCVAVGVGPGSFTGLRIGVGIAQGLALAADLPVVGISSLRALASHAGDGPVAAAFDARMGELYWGCYRVFDQGRCCEPVGREQVSPPTDVALPDAGPWLASGAGWQVYRDKLPSSVSESLSFTTEHRFPRATDIARLARAEFLNNNVVKAAELAPAYLRNRVVRKPG